MKNLIKKKYYLLYDLYIYIDHFLYCIFFDFTIVIYYVNMEIK